MIKVLTIGFLVYALFRVIRGSKKIERPIEENKADEEFVDYEEID